MRENKRQNSGRSNYVPKILVTALAAIAGVSLGAGAAAAQETIKVGVVQSLTGQLTAVGKQIMGGVNLYVQQHGNTVAGKKIELIVKDDTGVPDVARRLAQETDRQREGPLPRHRHHAGLVRDRAARHPGEDPGVVMVSGTSVGDRALALRGAHQLHARPAVRHHRPSGRTRTAARRS